MRTFGKMVLLLSLPWAMVYCVQAQAPAVAVESPYAMVQAAAKAIDGLVTLSGRIKRTERVKGVMESGDLRFKVNVKPMKIYIYNVDPHEGTEVLYAPGWNSDKVYIHPNQFPWVNLSLDPFGDQFLDGQHHHISSTGFVTIRRALRNFLGKPADVGAARVTYTGKEKWYGKMLDVIKIVNPDYSTRNYTVLAGEDMLKIDAKLNVPSYKILELNPGCDDYFDVKAGQVIKVPTDYGKEIVMMIDPVTHLPIVQIIMDDKGLFEKYEVSELKVNPRFSTLEFSEDNEEYGF